MRQYLVTVIGLNPEGCVLERLDDGPLEQDRLLFGIGVRVRQRSFLLKAVRSSPHLSQLLFSHLSVPGRLQRVPRGHR